MEIPAEDLLKSEMHTFYLPMHGVEKATSSTTKLCVASANISNGLSLNKILLFGPSFYSKLTTILLQFRQNDIGYSADISKMFHPEDRDLHR